MTNFEKIKAITANEMVECEMCVYQDIDCILLKCDDGIKKWLELEATDEQ